MPVYSGNIQMIVSHRACCCTAFVLPKLKIFDTWSKNVIVLGRIAPAPALQLVSQTACRVFCRLLASEWASRVFLIVFVNILCSCTSMEMLFFFCLYQLRTNSLTQTDKLAELGGCTSLRLPVILVQLEDVHQEPPFKCLLFYNFK